jgi:Flp pilus assembly protein CpaB
MGMLVRSPRALLLRVAAVGVGLLTATTVASDLARLHRQAGGLGSARPALVARTDLPIGTTLTTDDVTARTIHSSQLPPHVLRDARDVDGRVVVVPVLAGGFVGARNLAPRHRDGLGGVLPPGTRAMRVVVTSSLRPHRGAAVDVLATPTVQSLDRASNAARAGSATVVVAYGALVLGTDRETGNAGTLGVTLLVAEEQALDLAAAAAQGVLTLALVPPEEARGPSIFGTG